MSRSRDRLIVELNRPRSWGDLAALGVVMFLCGPIGWVLFAFEVKRLLDEQKTNGDKP